jgi:hypothetical protein
MIPCQARSSGPISMVGSMPMVIVAAVTAVDQIWMKDGI